MHHVYESLSHFLHDAAPYNGRMEAQHEWDLGVSGAEAKVKALSGDPIIADKAAALIDQIEPDIGDVAASVWVSDVAGSRVSVPDYLTGKPNHMRRRVRSEASGRSVNVFVDISSSAGVDALDLVSRGCAILALLETLQRCQVSVNLSIGMLCRSRTEPDGEVAVSIPVESRPLDISSASFILAHPAFARNVLYYVLERKYGSPLTWSKFGNDDKKRRDYLGLCDTDIYVPAAHLYDKQIIDDPKKWVEERAKQWLTSSSVTTKKNS